MEVVGAKDVTNGGFDEIPERRVWRKKVASSSGRFNHASLVVGRWSFRRPLFVKSWALLCLTVRLDQFIVESSFADPAWQSIATMDGNGARG